MRRHQYIKQSGMQNRQPILVHIPPLSQLLLGIKKFVRVKMWRRLISSDLQTLATRSLRRVSSDRFYSTTPFRRTSPLFSPAAAAASVSGISFLFFFQIFRFISFVCRNIRFIHRNYVIMFEIMCLELELGFGEIVLSGLLLMCIYGCRE